MQDQHTPPLVAVEHAARRLDDLTVAPAPQFLRTTAAVGMVGQLLDMGEYPPQQLRSSRRIFQRDVIRNVVE